MTQPPETTEKLAQQPLFPEMEPDFLDLPISVAKPGDYLFVQFFAGFGGLFRLAPVDIDTALEDWADTREDTLMVLPAPLFPGISGVPDNTEGHMMAMTIIDKRLVKDIQHVPEEELQQFTEKYERDNPIAGTPSTETEAPTTAPSQLLDSD